MLLLWCIARGTESTQFKACILIGRSRLICGWWNLPVERLSSTAARFMWTVSTIIESCRLINFILFQHGCAGSFGFGIRASCACFFGGVLDHFNGPILRRFIYEKERVDCQNPKELKMRQ